MKSNTTSSTSSGIGFIGMLTILFIGLKLTGFVGWAWVWVLSPLWISLIIKFILILILGLGVYIGAKKLDS